MNNRPSSAILPAYAGQNFAPAKPILRAKETDKVTRTYLTDAIRDKYKGLMEIDKSTWREIIGAGQLIALFIQGKQTLVYNPFAQSYVPVALQANDATRARGGMNVMQFYSTKHTQQWLGSNPDIEIVPCGNDDRIIAAARAADIIVDSYERKFYHPSFSAQEAILVQCFGTAINRIRFDHDIKGAKVLRDIVEDEEMEISEGFGACEDCGFSGTGKVFGQEKVAEGVEMPCCPECGSMAVTHEPPVTQIMPVVKGREYVDHGDLRIDLVAVPQCRWDLRTRLEESSWAVIEQETSLGAVERFLGGKLKVSERESENQFAFDVMNAITQMGSGSTNSAHSGLSANRDGDRRSVTVSEMFLSPDELADLPPLIADEQTVDGGMLPRGKRLIELFPEGVCVVGLNGFSVITGLYAEKHCDQFSTGVYHVKPLTGAGKGLADMVETQKRLNKLDTQNLEYMQGTATPAVLYAKGAISGGEMKYLGHPKANIPIDLSKFPEVTSLSQLVFPIPPQNAGAQFFEYTYNTLNNFMQLQSHVTEFSGGLPNVNNSTATGAQISAALAQSLFAPLLAGKTDLRKNNARNIVQLFKKHFPQPKFFADRYKGLQRVNKGRWLAGADCDGDFEFHVIQDSEAPKNLFTKRQELMEMFGIFGGFEGFMMARQASPEMVNEICRLYDIDIESEDYDESGEICRERLESAKEVLEKMTFGAQMLFGQDAEQMIDPYIVIDAVAPPIEPLELYQDRKMEWFRRFLDSDEGREMDKQMRGVINAFIGTHFANLQMEQQALAMAAGAAQQAMQQPAAEAQMQMQQEQGQMQMEQSAMQHEQELAQNDEKTQQDLARKQAETEMEAEREQVKSNAKMDQAAIDIATKRLNQPVFCNPTNLSLHRISRNYD